MALAIKIVIVDENPVRAVILADGLNEAGYRQVTHIKKRAISSPTSTLSIRMSF